MARVGPGGGETVGETRCRGDTAAASAGGGGKAIGLWGLRCCINVLGEGAIE